MCIKYKLFICIYFKINEKYCYLIFVLATYLLLCFGSSSVSVFSNLMFKKFILVQARYKISLLSFLLQKSLRYNAQYLLF